MSNERHIYTFDEAGIVNSLKFVPLKLFGFLLGGGAHAVISESTGIFQCTHRYPGPVHSQISGPSALMLEQSLFFMSFSSHKVSNLLQLYVCMYVCLLTGLGK